MRAMVYISINNHRFGTERGFEKGRFKLCPLIETDQAVLRSCKCKSSPRLVGLLVVKII